MTNIGTGLLALAATASIAMANGDEDKKKQPGFLSNVQIQSKAGEGFTITDEASNFSLNVRNLLQGKYTYASNEGAANTNSFTVRRARTYFRGTAYTKDLHYAFSAEWTDGGSTVKDGWIQWNFMNDEENTLGVRVGQTKQHFGRSWTSFEGGLDLIERDGATNVFAGTRAQGAALHGSHMPDDKLNWTFGIYNRGAATGNAAALEENANDDNELTFVGAVRFDPMGDMGGEDYQEGDLERTEELKVSFGAGVELENQSVGGSDVESTTVNINAAAKVQGWHGLADVFLRSDDVDGGAEADSEGYSIAGSYTLEKQEGSKIQWGGAVRITQLSFDATTSGLTATPLAGAAGDVLNLTAGVNAFYYGRNCKAQANYTFQQLEPDAGGDTDNHIIEIMITLLF